MIIRLLLNSRVVSPFLSLNKSYSLLYKNVGVSFLTINSVYFQRNSCFYHTSMDLSSVIEAFETLVPKHLAEKWDNTGLLVEPSQQIAVSTIFFTNDLTEDVLKEALAEKSNMIISYHPPLFAAFKALHCENWKDRITMACIAKNIAVYSPHTACDAVEGGVNDWLLKCFDLKDVAPIKPSNETNSHVIECITQGDISYNFLLDIGVEFTVLMKSDYEDKKCFKILTSSTHSATIFQALLANPAVLTVSSNQCKQLKHSELTGMGRIGKMKKPLKLDNCIQLVKNHLKLKNIRLALGMDCTSDTEITTVAVCAGSGASLLKGVSADLYITGEMSHHDLLDAIHKKTSVILCEHSNSERGYLVELVEQLRPLLKGINLVISKVDKDPIDIV